MTSSKETELILPISYIGCMLLFTLMRKLKLEKYLKGHQISIAIGVGITCVLSFAHYLDFITYYSVSPLTLFLQSLCFVFSLYQRSEFDLKETLWFIVGVGLQAGLCYFNEEECDRYAKLVLGIFSALHFFTGISNYRANSGKTRLGALWISFSVFGLYATFMCEDTVKQDLTLSYALVGITNLLIVKINHPILGDKLPEATSGSMDPEATNWRM